MHLRYNVIYNDIIDNFLYRKNLEDTKHGLHVVKLISVLIDVAIGGYNWRI